MTRFAKLNALVLLAGIFCAWPSVTPAQVSVGVAVRIGPPALPVYAQPVCPGPGYLWTPGYWAYGPSGYYWVPGTWVLAPAVGLLWTPGYWGWSGGFYAWHAGYWGPRVGFYGGINYGYGYGGVGFVGGTWSGGVFSYNRAVSNVNTTVVNNTYYHTTVVNNTGNRVSYNGGSGGTTAQPNAQELAAANEKHSAPTAMQAQHVEAASSNRAMLASVNEGQPAVAATPKPGVFNGPGVSAAHAVNADRPPTANKSARLNDSRPATSNTGQNTHSPNTHHNPSQASPNSKPAASSKPPQHEQAPGNPHPKQAPHGFSPRPSVWHSAPTGNRGASHERS
jgi:hypothetical protein